MKQEFQAEEGSAESHEAGELVDFSQFDSLVDGPRSPCVEIYRDFIKAALRSLDELQEAASKGSFESVESIAHQVSGSAALLGLVRFSGRMKTSELNAREKESLAHYATEKWVRDLRLVLSLTTDRVEAVRGISP